MCTYRRACPYSAYEYFMELLKISMYLREFQRGLLHRHLHHPLQLLVRMLGKIKISGLLLILAFSLSYKLKKHPAFPPTPRQGLVVEVEFPSSSASSCLSLQNGRKNIFFFMYLFALCISSLLRTLAQFFMYATLSRVRCGGQTSTWSAVP